MTLVDGAVYVPTGSICDRPIEGKVFRLATDTRALTMWIAVPYTLGGGGGMWGWGGIAYSATRDSLLVATGNALEGGSNSGARFREWAGYGEHVVELSRDLAIRSSHHPRDITTPIDLDFAGSPVVISPPGCGELVIVGNKNGRIYAWRSAAIGAGVRWSFRPPGTPRSLPLVGQLAYARATGSILVATYSKLVRIDLSGRCVPRVVWAATIGGRELLNGSPTVAGGLVWVTRSEPKPALLGVDLRTGRIRFEAPIPHPAFVAPTAIDGRLYVGTMSGELLAYRVR
jgi:hypothetical protein